MRRSNSGHRYTALLQVRSWPDARSMGNPPSFTDVRISSGVHICVTPNRKQIMVASSEMLEDVKEGEVVSESVVSVLEFKTGHTRGASGICSWVAEWSGAPNVSRGSSARQLLKTTTTAAQQASPTPPLPRRSMD